MLYRIGQSDRGKAVRAILVSITDRRGRERGATSARASPAKSRAPPAFNCSGLRPKLVLLSANPAESGGEIGGRTWIRTDLVDFRPFMILLD